MTSTVGTPILSRHAPSQEEPGTKRQPVPNTGEFASLIHRARGAIDRPPRAVIPAAKARNLGTGNAPKMSAPAKEEDSAAAPIPSWPAGFVAPVSSQPVAVPEPAIEDSGSERASSDSTDVGLPLIPAPAAEQKEHRQTRGAWGPGPSGQVGRRFRLHASPLHPHSFHEHLSHQIRDGNGAEGGRQPAHQEPRSACGVAGRKWKCVRGRACKDRFTSAGSRGVPNRAGPSRHGEHAGE